jgi:hypothetical protein
VFFSRFRRGVVAGLWRRVAAAAAGNGATRQLCYFFPAPFFCSLSSVHPPPCVLFSICPFLFPSLTCSPVPHRGIFVFYTSPYILYLSLLPFPDLYPSPTEYYVPSFAIIPPPYGDIKKAPLYVSLLFLHFFTLSPFLRCLATLSFFRITRSHKTSELLFFSGYEEMKNDIYFQQRRAGLGP